MLCAGLTCLVVHVSPPFLDTDTNIGAAPAPWNLAKHTYTLPKNRLEEALSAQICSLSANVAELCLLTITGCRHADSSPAAAASGSSVRETAIASKPLNPGSPKLALTVEARFATYSREPLSHEKPPGPGRGPNASAGSPSETRPTSS